MNYTRRFRQALDRHNNGTSPAPVSLALLRPHWWRLVALCRAVCQLGKHGYLVIAIAAAIVGAVVTGIAETESVFSKAFAIFYLIVIGLILLTLLAVLGMRIASVLLRSLSSQQHASYILHLHNMVLVYLQFGHMDDVCSNYTAMWWKHFNIAAAVDDNDHIDSAEPLSLVMFLDNGLPLEVPCARNMDDAAFLQHIAPFYYLQKIRKGLLEVIGFKTLGIVEVVEMQGTMAVGRRDTVLGLGRYDGNRMVYFFRHPKELRGNTIVRLLQEKGVLTEAREPQHHHQNSPARPGSPSSSGPVVNGSIFEAGVGGGGAAHLRGPVDYPVDNLHDIPFYRLRSALNDILQDPPEARPDEKVRALNFVSTWHTNFAALAVAAPVIASVTVSVAWPAIAVLKYNLDVQTSVQTGFTVGTYVVTAGALLIALVTFAASVYDTNAKYTEDLQSQIIRV